jgi:hypothetical protein
MKHLMAAILLIGVLVAAALGQDPGWPRQIKTQGGMLIYYQPQVDNWQSFTELTWRMAFTLTPTGGKQVVGVVEMQGHTDVDNDNKMVLISNLQVTGTHFPSLDPATASQMEQLVKTFLPPTVSISLHRLVAVVQKAETVPGVPVNNDPPVIVVAYSPSILLGVDGEPTLAEIPKTNLQYVVNTTWPLFFEKSGSNYYLLVGQQWMTAHSLDGPWSATKKLPKDMSKMAKDPQWAGLKPMIPPPAHSNGIIPQIFYSNRPAEIILFDGQPIYSKIPGTQLVYSTNTSAYLFLYTATNQFYYLTGGRWFRANSLTGPWSFATLDLPADFARIPPSSPASVILASVPGTEEAKDAVLLAQIPTTMTVNQSAAANVKVVYGGEPQFVPITGTSLYYASNTQDKVIQVGDVYYLCLQGVWFTSTTPQGPWTVANSVPQVIYTIPASSPVYNVTYVTQTVVAGDVQSSYTAGYMGAFIVGAAVGAIVANGSGYYYPPYIYHPAYGYPAYYPYPATYGAYGVYGSSAVHYNSATGAYGVSQTVSGPYGTATRGASYNPYTGTSTRYASASTAYGSRSAASAYNPYTGNYAATRQGSSPTAQWGSSVVSNGNKSAYTQHYSTARGTVGSVQTSSGGKAVGSSTAYGNSAVGKTANGDMYAGHDGNVYKNTGSGWQSYNNGSWNSVNKPTPTSAQQNAQSFKQPSSSGQSSFNRSSEASSSQMKGLQQESQNRQRGSQESSRFQQSGGGRFGGGGERFGGGRR